MLSALAFGVGIWEVVIIIAIVLILFGSTKIPQLMRGMGSGIHEFKKGLKEGEKEAEKEAEKKDDAKPGEGEKK